MKRIMLTPAQQAAVEFCIPPGPGISDHPALRYLHVTPKHTEASDGFVAARVSVASCDPDEFPRHAAGEYEPTDGAPTSVLLKPDAVRKATAATAKPKRGSVPLPILTQVLVEEDKDGKTTVYGTDLTAVGKAESAPAEADYPDLDAVLPKAGPMAVALDAALLAKAARWLQRNGVKRHGGRAPVVRIYLAQDSPRERAVLLEADVEGGIAAVWIMPVGTADKEAG